MFTATTSEVNPVYDITLIGLVSQIVHFIQPSAVGGGSHAVQRTSRIAYSVFSEKNASFWAASSSIAWGVFVCTILAHLVGAVRGKGFFFFL